MSFLIDTHALLWISQDHSNLSSRARQVFLDSQNDILVSVASLWEIAIKLSLGKLKLEEGLIDFIQKNVYNNNVGILQISDEHLKFLVDLPFHHRDPFDRLIIAQAAVEKLNIITRDESIRRYDQVSCLW